MSGTEVERSDAPAFMAARRNQWDDEMRKVIAATVAKGANPAQFAMFLELAAHLGLNPLAKEIWCAAQPGRNGGEGNVLIMVGRDGLLRKAEDSGEFEGIDGDVVRENDDFRVVRSDGKREIIHNYEGGAEKRGPIVGAWAEVYRTGRSPVYFFAPLSEYMPKSEKKREYSPWGSQTSTMILKCAQTYVLRIGWRVTGVVGEDEMWKARADADFEGTAVEEVPEPNWGPDEEVGLKLRDAFLTLEELGHGWLPAKVKAVLEPLDDPGRRDLLVDLELQINAARMHAEAEVVEAEVASA